MVCIYCHSPTKVINSRLQKRTNTTWRRRQCIQCKSTTTTIEETDLALGILFLNNSNTEALSRDKLFISIYDSCRHRADAVNDATHLCTTVLQRCLLAQKTPGTLERDVLVRIAIETLYNFDRVAGTFYRAYHAVNDN